MKRLVKCEACAKCAIGYETGFAGRKLMRCSDRGAYVTGDDGCTMGEPGEPGALCFGWDVTIEGHESVYGN